MVESIINLKGHALLVLIFEIYRWLSVIALIWFGSIYLPLTIAKSLYIKSDESLNFAICCILYEEYFADGTYLNCFSSNEHMNFRWIDVYSYIVFIFI